MIDADLVLIHGFWSSPATWDQVAERVHADLELRGLRVHRFRYESPKLPMPFGATRIPDYNDVAQSLRSYLAATVSGRVTAIVTHSQGGLILQRFLAWMLNEGYGQDLASVKLVLMLACPNDGSEFGRSIRKMARFGRHAQARDLEVLSSDVTDARRTVLRQVVYADTVSARECRIPFRVYAGRTDRVVTRASAQSAFPDAETLPGDHFSILHAAKPDNLTFATLKRHLIETFGEHPHITVAGRGPVVPPSPNFTDPVNGENVVVRWNPTLVRWTSSPHPTSRCHGSGNCARSSRMSSEENYPPQAPFHEVQKAWDDFDRTGHGEDLDKIVALLRNTVLK